MKQEQSNRVVTAVVSLFILGFVSISLISFFVARRSLRREIRENYLPLTSDRLYSELQKDLLYPVLISSSMSANSFLKEWVIHSEDDTAIIHRYLKEVQDRYNAFTAFFASEKSQNYYQSNGHIVALRPDTTRDDWYYRSRDMKENHEVNIAVGNKDSLTIYVNYKVTDTNGSVLGVAGLGFTVNSLKRLIEKYQREYERTIYFIDAAGTITVGSEKQLNETVELQQVCKKSAKLASENRTYSHMFKRDGKNIHANIRYIEEFDWFLVVEQHEAPMLKETVRTLLINLGICSIITIIITLLVRYVVISYQKHIDVLHGILPICAYCREIRDDEGYWKKVDEYISEHSDLKFSHSICPSCAEKYFSDLVDEES